MAITLKEGVSEEMLSGEEGSVGPYTEHYCALLDNIIIDLVKATRLGGVVHGQAAAPKYLVLRYFLKASDTAPRGQLHVRGVRDVPDRGGTARSNRFDVVCTGKSGAEETLSLAAAAPEEKERWMTALAAVVCRFKLAEHPRLDEFRRKAPGATAAVLDSEAKEHTSLPEEQAHADARSAGGGGGAGAAGGAARARGAGRAGARGAQMAAGGGGQLWERVRFDSEPPGESLYLGRQELGEMHANVNRTDFAWAMNQYTQMGGCAVVGILHKKGRTTGRSWQERHFALDATHLSEERYAMFAGQLSRFDHRNRE
jgi:hypothetical protein